MRYLIDTNVLLWALEDSRELSAKAREAIATLDNEIYLSIASLWEVAIKMSINKLDLSRTFDEIISEIQNLEFTLLPVSVEDLRKIRTMPFHHKDPFDRLIIAQAQSNDLNVIIRDQKFELYDVDIVW